MFIDDIKAAQVGAEVWDKDDRGVTGLYARVLTDKTVSFYVYYRTKIGKKRNLKLGTFGELTVGAARDVARAYLLEVANGRDPKEERDKAKGELYVKDLYNTVWEKYWNTERFLKSRHAQGVRNLWKNHLERAFGPLRLSEVTPPVVREWRDGFAGQKEFTANRALEVLSRLFNYAEEHGIRALGTNPCSVVPAFKERKRSRYARKDELPKLLAEFDKRLKTHPREVAFAYTVLYSGSRLRAIERARPEHLERLEHAGETYGILKLAGKTFEETGEDDTIVLPPKVLKLIEALPPAKNGTIFGIETPHDFWYEVRTAAGCKDLWFRDLRRTFATVGMSDGVHIGVIGELLNHRSVETTKIYAKVMQGARLDAVTQIAQQLDMFKAKKPARKK